MDFCRLILDLLNNQERIQDFNVAVWENPIFRLFLIVPDFLPHFSQNYKFRQSEFTLFRLRKSATDNPHIFNIMIGEEDIFLNGNVN